LRKSNLPRTAISPGRFAFKIQRLTGIFAGNVKDAPRDASKTAIKQPALRAKNRPLGGFSLIAIAAE